MRTTVPVDSFMLRGDLGTAYEVNGFPDAAFASYQNAETLDQNNARWPISSH